MSRVASAFLAIVFLVSVAWCRQIPQRGEIFSAVATGWVAGSIAIPFDFRVTHYGTEAEMDRYARLLSERGPTALATELAKGNVGQIERAGISHNRIAIAHKVRMGSDTVIMLITACNMPFRELYAPGGGTDYPLGVLQITLKGRTGSGRILVAAKFHFNPQKRHYEIESYKGYCIKAVNVRLISGRPSHPLRSTYSGCKLAATCICNG